MNSKPLPPAKPVNMPSGITAETFGDIAMIADFVHTYRHLLVPKESLHISIGKQCNGNKMARLVSFLQAQYFLKLAKE